MPDGRVVEIDAIPALETLPRIPAPRDLLGTRAIESSLATDALLLADARPFHVDLGHASLITSDEPASEQGKRRR